MKLTGWYRGEQKPVRVGFYQREDHYGIIYAYWNGRHWRVGFPIYENAFFWADLPCGSMYQDLPWRGVAK
ncbi:hypothetical protein [Undibacterium sp.]|uniref:hypothetical protein n=1 Tax=Undibacterium sp. TaxID=1914977 RepID=UPI003753DD63